MTKHAVDKVRSFDVCGGLKKGDSVVAAAPSLRPSAERKASATQPLPARLKPCP
jgi:hypothetical protein